MKAWVVRGGVPAAAPDDNFDGFVDIKGNEEGRRVLPWTDLSVRELGMSKRASDELWGFWLLKEVNYLYRSHLGAIIVSKFLFLFFFLIFTHQ